MRAGDLIGQTAYRPDGTALGRIADLVVKPDGPHRRPRVVAAVVTPRHRGRMFGFDRSEVRGPALLRAIARFLHRGTTVVPWAELNTRPPSGSDG